MRKKRYRSRKRRGEWGGKIERKEKKKRERGLDGVRKIERKSWRKNKRRVSWRLRGL